MTRRQRQICKRLLVQAGARMVHAHFGPNGLAIQSVAQELSLPLLVTFHGYDASSCLRDPAYVEALDGLFKHARGLAVCDSIRQRLIRAGVPSDRVQTHYIGVSTSDFPYRARKAIASKAANGERINLLQVGRFVEKKGHEYTIRAFADFSRHCPNSVLTLAGDGPLLHRCQALSSELGLGSRIVFTGPQEPSEIRSLLLASDAFLHHSITASDGDQEGIPISIMEAMATGLPVIATSHSGIPEVVRHWANGLLTPERDLVAYAAALKQLLTFGSEFGLRGRHRIEASFNLDKQNEMLVKIYASLLSCGGPAAKTQTARSSATYD